MKESLERELRSVGDKLDGITARFDTQATRLERHAMLWQTGRRWSARMDDWADRIDAALETRDREIAELRKRITDLENKVR